MTPVLALHCTRAIETVQQGLHRFRVITDCVNAERKTGQEQNGENEPCDDFIHQKETFT